MTRQRSDPARFESERGNRAFLPLLCFAAPFAAFHLTTTTQHLHRNDTASIKHHTATRAALPVDVLVAVHH
jgi:hypothetical protein